MKKETNKGKNIKDDLQGLEGAMEGLSVQQQSSDESPDSSDEEFGAKTLLRATEKKVSNIPSINYAINENDAEEVTEDEIARNPGKYYVVNFRGEHLSYFSNTQQRREAVSILVSPKGGKNVPYKSIAVKGIEKKFPQDQAKVGEEFSKLQTPTKLQDSDFIKKYKSPPHFANAIQSVSPSYGNPFISTSKVPSIATQYADHSTDETKKPHPKYSVGKKPKHRLIGSTLVIVQEANEYIRRSKADIEKLRTEGKIGGKSGVERENQEILFDGQIDSGNIAGYVPLVYPNLSKEYSDEDKKLFGLDGKSKRWSITRGSIRTLGDKTKKESIYRANNELQWRLAEKYVKDKNSEGELLWVDNEGKFRRFKINQIDKGGEKEVARNLASEFADVVEEPGNLVEAQLQRIENHNEFYADDEVNNLIEMNLPPDVNYIGPATARIQQGFDDAISNFINDNNFNQAIISIAAENHFTFLHIRRGQDNNFAITYFDPVVVGGQPEHDILEHIRQSLGNHFPNVPIINTTTAIQTYRYLDNGYIEIDNHHCGAFVTYFANQMIMGNMEVLENGRIRGRTSGNDWVEMNDLNQEQSNNLGITIRQEQARILRGEDIQNIPLGDLIVDQKLNIKEQKEVDDADKHESYGATKPLETITRDLMNAIDEVAEQPSLTPSTKGKSPETLKPEEKERKI